MRAAEGSKTNQAMIMKIKMQYFVQKTLSANNPGN